MAESATAGAMATAKDTAVEVVEVALLIITVVLFFFGFVASQTLGLSGLLYTFTSQAPIGASVQVTLAEGAAALVWAGLGLGLVAIGRKHDHWVGRVVVAVGALFLGAGIAEAANWAMGGAPYAGILDGGQLMSSLQTTTGGG